MCIFEVGFTNATVVQAWNLRRHNKYTISVGLLATQLDFKSSERNQRQALATGETYTSFARKLKLTSVYSHLKSWQEQLSDQQHIIALNYQFALDFNLFDVARRIPTLA